VTAETQAAATTAAATRPGIYDIPAHVYHADRTSLSSTGARKLLPPSCPAKFRWEQDHPPARKKELDFGTAVHSYVLGSGQELAVIGEADWRSKHAQTQKASAIREGKVPLLASEYKQVQEMAKVLRAHPLAGALFAEGAGYAEKSLYWVDSATGVTCRARPDWIPNNGGGRLWLPDLKTTVAADDESVSKHLHNYGYHQQAAWYLEGARALGLGDRDATFVLVFQEKTPPYLVRCVQLDLMALRVADAKNHRARQKFAECTASGEWPGYGDDTKADFISLPPWVENRDMEEYL